MIAVRNWLGGALLAMVVAPAWAQTDLDLSACAMPEVPNVPDGSVATADQMVASGTAVREFNAATETQLTCLDGITKSLGEEITAEQKAMINAAYNVGVDQLTAVVEKYNLAVRAYKAANPSG